MSTQHKVIFIGMDAVDADLVDCFIAHGGMPNLAKLTREGTSRRLENCLETLPGAIWPEISSGIPGALSGEFYHPGQVITGEARIRPLDSRDIDSSSYFWIVASRAGKRVGLVDIPQTVHDPDFNGLAVYEWGLHDRLFHPCSVPESLLDQLRERYGDHPVQQRACDEMSGKGHYDDLLAHLLVGCERKADLILDVYGREDWDMFVCCFGEGHCAGHQFWELHELHNAASSNQSNGSAVSALQQVYEKIDKGVGRLVEAAGAGTQIFVLASHGIGLYTGGPQLLGEVLARLGMNGLTETSARRWLRASHNQARQLPWPVKKLLRQCLDFAPLRRLQGSIGASLDPFESSLTLAAPVRNNRCGAIRINLKGREPFGRVDPGQDQYDLEAFLISELEALKDPNSGERIIRETVRTRELYEGNLHPNVPDLLVRFRTDCGRIEECESVRVGHVFEPINSPGYPRSGDHRPVSRLWHFGAGAVAGELRKGGHILDVAPTILAALGVATPPAMQGQPLGADLRKLS